MCDMDTPTGIKHRLEALLPDAKQVMGIAGTPGAAIAVLHDGQLLNSEYIGFRDVENRVCVLGIFLRTNIVIGEA